MGTNWRSSRRFKGKEIHVGVVDGDPVEVGIDAVHFPAAARSAFPPRVFDEDFPHRVGGSREEMPAAGPGALLVAADETQVGFMNQGGGLERLPRPLLGKPAGGQPTQLVVDKRQQLVRGVRVALLNRFKEMRDVAHRDEHKRLELDRQTLGQNLSLSRSGSPLFAPLLLDRAIDGRGPVEDIVGQFADRPGEDFLGLSAECRQLLGVLSG